MDAQGEVVLTQVGWATKSPTEPRRHELYWLAPSGKVYAWDGDDNGWVQIYPAQSHPCKEINHG